MRAPIPPHRQAVFPMRGWTSPPTKPRCPNTNKSHADGNAMLLSTGCIHWTLPVVQSGSGCEGRNHSTGSRKAAISPSVNQAEQRRANKHSERLATKQCPNTTGQIEFRTHAPATPPTVYAHTLHAHATAAYRPLICRKPQGLLSSSKLHKKSPPAPSTPCS